MAKALPRPRSSAARIRSGIDQNRSMLLDVLRRIERIEQDSGIQFQRVAQLQAELDAVKQKLAKLTHGVT